MAEKYGKTKYVRLWDRMEGEWLWTPIRTVFMLSNHLGREVALVAIASCSLFFFNIQGHNSGLLKVNAANFCFVLWFSGIGYSFRLFPFFIQYNDSHRCSFIHSLRVHFTYISAPRSVEGLPVMPSQDSKSSQLLDSNLGSAD